MITLNTEQKEQYGNILSKLAESIDLTETEYRMAIDRYTTIGEFLSSPDSLLYWMRPKVKSQGSVRIGTPVRPIKEDMEFDVDLTCILQASIPAIQRELKNGVRDQLWTDDRYKQMLEEMRRCWRLKYAESSKFHLDIVPAIPDNFEWLLQLNVPLRYAQHAICITDMEKSNYKDQSWDLPKSNTEGYALWFLDITKIAADRIRAELKETLAYNSVDDIPEYKIRTALQKGIQLMKRHRDIMFQDTADCPVSIILTTLGPGIRAGDAGGKFDHVLRHHTKNCRIDADIY